MNQERYSERAEQLQSLLSPILRAAYGMAYTLTKNRADAEDLVQTAALRALKYFATFEPGTNFKAWFYRILTNLFLEGHRQQKRRPSSVDLDSVGDLYLFRATAAAELHQRMDDPARALLTKVTTEQVQSALQALPAQYAIVATLYFMTDMAYGDIAETLQLPIGTVRSRLHRARAMLQKSLWTLAVDAGIIAEMTGSSS